ncbi:hypothetical protein Plhal304r1_c017g0063161 [Plasmopara halstedii]
MMDIPWVLEAGKRCNECQTLNACWTKNTHRLTISGPYRPTSAKRTPPEDLSYG